MSVRPPRPVATGLAIGLASAIAVAAGCTTGAPGDATVRSRTSTSGVRGAPAAVADAYDADSWFRLQRAYPTGRVPDAGTLDRAMRARQPRDGIRPRLNLPGETWVSIGPRPIVTSGHPYAGRVTTLVTHPTDPNTLYLGADSGGLWRTTDAGATWTALTPDLPVPAIQSLAIDPVDPRLLYASTIQRTYGTRWLRSTDAGATWSVESITTAAGQTLSPSLCSVNVYKACIPPSSGRIIVEPAHAGSAATSTIYYAGVSHLLRSDDSGRTFRPVLALADDLDFAGADAANVHPEAEFIRDVALDPVRPDHLYVAVAQPRCTTDACDRMRSDVLLYRTIDGGAHWTRQPIGSLAEYALGNTRYADPGAVYVPRVRLAIAPSAPDVVALAFRDEILGRPRVYRSADAGATWAETSPPASALTWPLALAIAPGAPDTMYVGSSTNYRTTDAGATWVTLGGTHADNITFAFDAAGTLLVGNDGGIFKLAPSLAFTPLHRALPITEFYSVAAHPSNPLLLAGGTQDNGTVVFQGALGWSLITGGDGGDTVFDPRPGTTTLYAEVEWYFIDGANVFQFYRCEPAGCLNRVAGLDRTVGGPFIPRMALDPSSPATIWLTAEKLFRTDSRGDAWTAASSSIANDERCWIDPVAGRTCAPARYFTAAVVAPTASQTVYAGALNGDVRVTRDRGTTWQSVAGPDAGPLPVRAVNDIVVDPLAAGTAFVAYSGFDQAGSGRGHVFRTTDTGATWRDVTGTLPDVPVNTLLIDPDSAVTGTPRVLYAGTDIGVFRATITDADVVWTPFGGGLPPVVVNRLAYNASARQLLAATYGRGIWAISTRFR
ncbi:MAG: hypothetical protein R2752_11775 [Vicinamibacterales bacterium]